MLGDFNEGDNTTRGYLKKIIESLNLLIDKKLDLFSSKIIISYGF